MSWKGRRLERTSAKLSIIVTVIASGRKAEWFNGAALDEGSWGTFEVEYNRRTWRLNETRVAGEK